MCLFNHSLHFAEIKAVLEGRGFRPKTFGNRTRGAETAGRSYIYRTYRGILYIVCQERDLALALLNSGMKCVGAIPPWWPHRWRGQLLFSSPTKLSQRSNGDLYEFKMKRLRAIVQTV